MTKHIKVSKRSSITEGIDAFINLRLLNLPPLLVVDSITELLLIYFVVYILVIHFHLLVSIFLIDVDKYILSNRQPHTLWIHQVDPNIYFYYVAIERGS